MIQVYLYDSKEEAFVKDLGFAVAPGQHALVGVKLTKVSTSTKRQNEKYAKQSENVLESEILYFYERKYK